jgi:hypothetical protein
VPLEESTYRGFPDSPFKLLWDNALVLGVGPQQAHERSEFHLWTPVLFCRPNPWIQRRTILATGTDNTFDDSASLIAS